MKDIDKELEALLKDFGLDDDILLIDNEDDEWQESYSPTGSIADAYRNTF